MTPSVLYLLRHAKSSWADPALADHDRPLAARGRRAAAAIAAHMAEREIVPDLVLCSTSLRTRETYERLEAVLAGAPVRYERRVYAASASELLELLRAVPDEIGSVLLIGHNPGIEELALAVARPSPTRDDLQAKFPTGALATLELSRWSELAPGCGSLVDYVRPRDLAS
ncbi:SixA phosphatase family protein [Solirubrobacter soli]|uniref:SixA phosphatase family protein n=1 Tax=Solirubrobacter soli TaxID=363832 RepID=UPI00041CE27D|nr:histidine phosphatase family protein [Solirubrobacter soli]